MAENLQEFRRQVEEKEANRQALLEKLIITQELERRRIAQDLHDQLGQSLSVLLLEARSMDDGAHKCCEKHLLIEQRIAEALRERWERGEGGRPVERHEVFVVRVRYAPDIASKR